MKEEIEAIKGTIDVLIARSYAQEVVLLHFAKKQGSQEWFPYLDLDKTTAEIRHRLKHAALTDGQLALLDQELRALCQRLATLPPADELPF